ncbi:MAG: magnesium transporter [Phycisphaerae bacterium]
MTDLNSSERVVHHLPAAEAAFPRGDLVDAIETRDAVACKQWAAAVDANEAIHVVSSLEDDARASLVEILDADVAARLLALLPLPQAIEALADVDADVAAGILEELPSDERADLIGALDQEDADLILGALEDDVAADVRKLTAYDEDTAGGLMATEFLAFREDATIRDVLADMEANAEHYAEINIQYSYVVDGAGRLRGVLPIRDLLLSKRTRPIREMMIPEPVRVRDSADLRELERAFATNNFMGLPVVTTDDVLVGVIERSSVQYAAADEADNLYRQSQGIVGGEELRSMPLLLRSGRRLAWLSVNIVLNIAAASVIAFHQDTLAAAIALAVFLPIISDMSGCSGNQAVAVSMRELTLGVTRPRDWFRVFRKECAVGILNGVALGVLIGLVAFLWKNNVYLGLVVGAALAANTLIAVCIGGAVPLILKAFKTDPALASGPILTTITDMCGFLLVLTLASMLMTRLVA